MMTHKDLDAWKLSVELVQELYQITAGFPKEEMFGLTSQIRKSAVSIPSNIAEGSARNHKREYLQFLYVALGSAAELDTQLIIARNLGFIPAELYQSFSEKIVSVSKLIHGLIKRNKSTI